MWLAYGAAFVWRVVFGNLKYVLKAAINGVWRVAARNIPWHQWRRGVFGILGGVTLSVRPTPVMLTIIGGVLCLERRLNSGRYSPHRKKKKNNARPVASSGVINVAFKHSQRMAWRSVTRHSAGSPTQRQHVYGNSILMWQSDAYDIQRRRYVPGTSTVTVLKHRRSVAGEKQWQAAARGGSQRMASS